jgi:hypothetical protein
MTLVYLITPEASLGLIVLEKRYRVQALTVGTHVGGHSSAANSSICAGRLLTGVLSCRFMFG